MAKLIWAVPCSRILLDQPSNRVSYIDVLDGVSLSSFPTLAPLTFIGMFFQRENETKLEVRVRAYGVDGEPLMDSDPVTLNFEPNHKRFRVHIGLGGFQLAKPGRFGFGVEVKLRGKWHEIDRVPFDVEPLIEHGTDQIIQ
jgi:hypothetical protein